MDWTVGTFWTVGNDSRRLGLIGDWLDSWDTWDTWDTWERRRPGGKNLGAPPSRRLFLLRCWGEDSVTHEAWSHGLDRGDFRDRGE